MPEFLNFAVHFFKLPDVEPMIAPSRQTAILNMVFLTETQFGSNVENMSIAPEFRCASSELHPESAFNDTQTTTPLHGHRLTRKNR